MSHFPWNLLLYESSILFSPEQNQPNMTKNSQSCLNQMIQVITCYSRMHLWQNFQKFEGKVIIAPGWNSFGIDLQQHLADLAVFPYKNMHSSKDQSSQHWSALLPFGVQIKQTHYKNMPKYYSITWKRYTLLISIF